MPSTAPRAIRSGRRTLASPTYDAWGEWPRYYVCLSRGRGGGEAVIWNLKTAAIDALPGAPDLLRYLRFRWGEAIDFDEPVAAAELASFVPAIGERQAVVKRARHATFGIGTITRELGDKLEIDFGEQGTKLLLRRFIEEV